VLKTGYFVGGLILVLVGLGTTWIGTPAPDDPTTSQYDPYPWDFFCVGSGVGILALGALLLILGWRAPDPAPPAPAPAYGYPAYPYRPASPPYPGQVNVAAGPLPPPSWPSPAAVVPMPAGPTQCVSCRNTIAPGSRFCNHCGATQPPAPAPPPAVPPGPPASPPSPPS